jgi:hypothetical protein
MTRDDIQKLLGGYSTGTLTPEEQRALFAAALEDQELFDALAGEQALRDLLRDPTARAHVLAALDDRPEPWWRAARLVPRPVVAGALAACLAAVAGYGVWRARQPGRPALVATMREVQVAPGRPTSDASVARQAERRSSGTAPLAAPPAAKAAPSTSAPANRAVVSGSLSAQSRFQPSPLAPPPAVPGANRAREVEARPGVAPPAAKDAPSANALAMLDRSGSDAAGAGSGLPANGPALAPIPSRPAPPPPPRRFAAAAFAPKPATLKEDGSGAADQAAVSRAASEPTAGQPAPPSPEQSAGAASAPAPPAFALEKKGAAGSVRAPAAGKTSPSPADQLGAQGGASSESVTVTADATSPGGDGVSNQRTVDVPPVEMKWSALRREPDGRLSPVALVGIRAGDTIVVRLEPYADGILSVSEIVPGAAARVLIAGMRVKRAQPVDTPPVTLDHPGVRALPIHFTAGTGALRSTSVVAPSQTIELRFR